MNKALKSLSLELSKPVLEGLQVTPKAYVFVNTYGKISLITAMFHVLGFDGEKLERVLNIDESALRKYSFLLIRPFYHNLHVAMYVNRGKKWELFGRVTRSDVVFENDYRGVAFKTINNMGQWCRAIESTGITQFKAPTVDVLPSPTDIIRKFKHVYEHGAIGQYTMTLLDGMSRASDLGTYVRSMISIMHLNVNVHNDKIIVTTDVEGSSLQLEITEYVGRPPVRRQLKNNGKISEYIRDIRHANPENYGEFFDIVMLRSVKNTIAVIPTEHYEAHSIEYSVEEFNDELNQVIIDSYVMARDGRSHIRIYATIEVTK